MNGQESFIKDFIALRDGTIQPALLDIGRYLLEQGHQYEIGEGLTLKRPSPIRPPYAGVTLEVYPSDVDWKDSERLPFTMVPSITFGVDLSQRKVSVFVHPKCESSKNIIRVGPWTTKIVNSHDLSEVTADLIYEEVKEFFKKIPFDVELTA